MENNNEKNLEYKYEEEVKKIIEEIEKNKLEKIYNEINDLNDIGHDLNEILLKDQENLVEINKNVIKTEDNIIRTNIDLTDTLKYKNNKKKITIITTFAVLGIAGGGISAYLLGALGISSICGLTVGTGVLGGILGKGISKII